MVSERIDDSSYSPTVLVGNRPDHFGSCGNSPFEGGIRVRDHQEQSDRSTAERLGAKVEMLRRLVGDPEFGPSHR